MYVGAGGGGGGVDAGPVEHVASVVSERACHK